MIDCGHSWVDPSQEKLQLINGFDQEAAAVLVARLAAHRASQQDPQDVLRWVDRLLIKLCHKFAEFSKNDLTRFGLAPTMSIFPQFIFHLRRSNIIQVFGYSPDESAHIR